MTWRVRHTRTFYKELAKLPTEVRKQVEEVAFGEEIKWVDIAPVQRRPLQLPLPPPAAFLTRELAQDDTFSGTGC